MNQKNMGSFSKLRQPVNLLSIHFFLSAFFGLIVFISVLTSNSFDAGFSSGKMLLLGVVTIIVLILLMAGCDFLLKPDHAKAVDKVVLKDTKNRNTTLRVGCLGLVFCWVGYFLPSYLAWPEISGYLIHLKPLLAWGILHFFSIIVIIHFGTDEPSALVLPRPDKMLFAGTMAAFFLFLLAFIFVINTGFGISFQEDYWYGAGVPVLWTQISTSIFIGIIFSWLMNHVQFFKERARIDAFIFILIWIVTAYLWAKEPLQPSHFMPDTGVNALYPYSDSATFDIGSQYALIGQGLFNGQYFDRSLYSVLLTYLHVFAGQNTETLMLYQAIVYAVFPAILYLLGRALYSNVLGISFGFLIMFRGVNSIFGASLIDLAGPKMMLTDFPTAIGISLIILFIVQWLHHPVKMSNVIWAGCSIGFTLLLRTHVLLLLPFIIAFKMLYFKNTRKFWIYGSIFLISGMIISTLPLDFQNQKKGVPMFYMYYSRIQNVFEARYRTLDNPNTSLPEKSHKSAMIERERLIVYSYQKPYCSTKFCALSNHFFHNLAGSVLSLPASFVFDDFRHTVKEVAPYWGKDWIGQGVNLENYLLLLVNLTIISIGIGTVWAKRRLPGLFPLLIYFVYILSNSLAFTSGGRYFVPVDWIIYCYYIMGLLKICFWLLRQTGFNFKMNGQESAISATSGIVPIISFRNVITSFVAVFIIGSLLPLADYPFPRRYHEVNARDVLLTLTQRGLLEEVNLTERSVMEFLTNPDARLISGRILYPRFYPSGKGEPGQDYPYTALDYRRIVFMVIGPFGYIPSGVILPLENSQPGLHASDVIILGCAQNNFLDAAVVFVLSVPNKVYVRSTELLLQCPLVNP